MRLINRQDIKKRILWFSDIHFLEDELDDYKYLQKFLDKFIECCKSINEIQKIDYVIISGDLTNKGKKSEFENFFKYILSPLFKNLKNSKLITLPGNHDLTIENKFDYNKILDLKTKDKENFYLKDIEYNNFFKNYTNFCKKSRKYFPKDIQYPYSQHFLYGTYCDDENKLLFVILNSAWLSLSVKLLEHFLKEVYINPISDKVEKLKLKLDRKEVLSPVDIDEFLNFIKNLKQELTQKAYNISYKTIEYGTQELFLKFLFESEDLFYEYFDKYKDYYKISILHHSENHLNWNERIDSKSLFSKLKKQSDLILSSHEHVPKKYLQSHNLNEAHHLKSGPFIQLKFNDKPLKNNCFDEYNENELYVSTFSILDINISKKNLIDTRYGYEKKGVDKMWIKFDDKSYNQECKSINLNYSDIKRVFHKLKSVDNQLLLNKILGHKTSEIDKNLNIYKYKKDMYVLSNCSDFNSINFLDIKQKVKQNKIKRVLFFSIDILIDNLSNNDFFEVSNLNFYYSDQDTEQNFALGNLKSALMKKFNNFRSDFFNSLDMNELRFFSDVSFVFVLFPYWEIDRVL